jgi:signal transduction histidine kinase
VWLNYFNNAFHAIRTKGPEGGKICVKARHESDLRRVSVEITDTGRGMDEKTLALLRDLSLARGELAGTFAMGIRESARILAEHGGGFEISSEPGVGTTVRVHLACAEVQDRQQVKKQDQQPLKKEES